MVKHITFSKLLSVMVALFCFIAFPLFILFSALEYSYELKIDNLRSQKLAIMQKNLDQIEKYSDEKTYIHLLLKRIFNFAQEQSDPQNYLKLNIENLEKQYPSCFEFVVWDSTGQIDNKLTNSNRKNYRFIAMRLYKVLIEVAKALRDDIEVVVRDLDITKANTGLIRNYLGKFFWPENLKYPYMSDDKGKPILVDFANSFNSVWFQTGNKISFLCFIKDDALKKKQGLKNIIKILNSQNKHIISGFSWSPDIERSVIPLPENINKYVVRALAEFDFFSNSIFENDEVLILLGVAQKDIRSFSILPKKPKLWSKNILLYTRFIQCILLLLFIYAILFLFLKYHADFFSIRWKLIGLFIFANIAPLIILGFISHEYLSNKKVSLHNEVKSDLLKLLRDFDMRYTFAQSQVATKTNTFLYPIKKAVQNRPITDEEIAKIRKYLPETDALEAYLIASGGKVLLELSSSKTEAHQSNKFIPTFGTGVLKYSNGIFDEKSNNLFGNWLLSYDSAYFRDARKNSRKANVISMISKKMVYYWDIWGDHKNYSNDYFFILIWQNDKFQEKFVDLFFEKIKKDDDTVFYAKSIENSMTWPRNTNIPKKLLKKIEQAGGFKDSITGELQINNTTNIFACYRGKNLDTIIFSAIRPELQIQEEINKIRDIIAIGAVLSLILSLIVGQALSSQFLIPINALGNGALEVEAGNFRHRIPAGDEDEFGHLNTVFNRVIEGLEEVEVAKIVQENLLPGNYFEAGNFTIFGKSIAMTTLGGDYYDCFKINDNAWGIVIGDVAGHGIAAGLMMAMAKSGVLITSDNEKLDPAALVSSIHKIFRAIRNEKLKRMMTFQYFVFNPNTGLFNFTNAGHCFPIIIRPEQQHSELIEHTATPLGIGRKARFKNMEFNINPGEALFLYTDGIAEAKNTSGEEFGYNRLLEAVLKEYHHDAEIYYQKIYSVYNEWSKDPEDDLTMIIITHQKK